jgi:hypothetical protein
MAQRCWLSPELVAQIELDEQKSITFATPQYAMLDRERFFVIGRWPRGPMGRAVSLALDAARRRLPIGGARFLILPARLCYVDRLVRRQRVKQAITLVNEASGEVRRLRAGNRAAADRRQSHAHRHRN